MNIKVELFCSLATSPEWQTWLYKYDGSLYKKFIAKLRASKGCNDNRENMVAILDEIQAHGNSDKLYEFLRIKFPYIIKETKKSINKVFTNYVPNVLTYPRRIIINSNNCESEAKRFVASKGISDFIIVDGAVYIEYLERSEMHLKDKIPEASWQIRTYRKNMKNR